MLSAETLAALLIAFGTLVAAASLLRRRRDLRGGVLAALTLAGGLTLYLTLFPPHLPVGGETLVVATAETPERVRAKAGERLIALPEAPLIAGAERVPDLATALRRHLSVQRIHILGRGLTQRDRDTEAGLPVEFAPLPLPRGLVRLEPPADTAAGAIFALAGEAAGLDGGSAELLDPAGRRVDRRVIGREGRFTLGAAARAPGLASFTLRLRGRDTKVVSDTPVPLRAFAEKPLRALLIGAPSPETKYLRRWAEDSGIALSSKLDAGGGADLGGDVRVNLDAATLREADVVIIDDRSLLALGSGSRAVLGRAAAAGLGVVVRMTAPANAAARSSWRSLGLFVEDGSEVLPVALPPLAPDADTLASLRGPGSADASTDINTIDDPAPDVGRWSLRTGPNVVAAVTDADGAILTGWQQRGQGRIAVWTLANGFALVLSGQAERYYQWWSETVSAVARPDSAFHPDVPALPQVGERIAICGVTGSARVIAPDGSEVALAIDPGSGAKGCAAYWPSDAGVHRIVQPGRDGQQEFALAVLPENALAASGAREMGEATSRWAAVQNVPIARNVPDRRGPAWPWLLVWLLVSGLLWFAERRWRSEPTEAG